MSNGLDYHMELAARFLNRADTMAQRDETLSYVRDNILALATLAEAHIKFAAVQAYRKGQA